MDNWGLRVLIAILCVLMAVQVASPTTVSSQYIMVSNCGIDTSEGSTVNSVTCGNTIRYYCTVNDTLDGSSGVTDVVFEVGEGTTLKSHDFTAQKTNGNLTDGVWSINFTVSVPETGVNQSQYYLKGVKVGSSVYVDSTQVRCDVTRSAGSFTGLLDQISDIGLIFFPVVGIITIGSIYGAQPDYCDVSLTNRTVISNCTCANYQPDFSECTINNTRTVSWSSIASACLVTDSGFEFSDTVVDCDYCDPLWTAYYDGCNVDNFNVLSGYANKTYLMGSGVSPNGTDCCSRTGSYAGQTIFNHYGGSDCSAPGDTGAEGSCLQDTWLNNGGDVGQTGYNKIPAYGGDGMNDITFSDLATASVAFGTNQPLLVDLDGDGKSEIILMESSELAAYSLSISSGVLSQDYSIFSTKPFVGKPAVYGIRESSTGSYTCNSGTPCNTSVVLLTNATMMLYGYSGGAFINRINATLGHNMASASNKPGVVCYGTYCYAKSLDNYGIRVNMITGVVSTLDLTSVHTYTDIDTDSTPAFADVDADGTDEVIFYGVTNESGVTGALICKAELDLSGKSCIDPDTYGTTRTIEGISIIGTGVNAKVAFTGESTSGAYTTYTLSRVSFTGVEALSSVDIWTGINDGCLSNPVNVMCGQSVDANDMDIGIIRYNGPSAGSVGTTDEYLGSGATGMAPTGESEIFSGRIDENGSRYYSSQNISGVVQTTPIIVDTDRDGEVEIWVNIANYTYVYNYDLSILEVSRNMINIAGKSMFAGDWDTDGYNEVMLFANGSFYVLTHNSTDVVIVTKVDSAYNMTGNSTVGYSGGTEVVSFGFYDSADEYYHVYYKTIFGNIGGSNRICTLYSDVGSPSGILCRDYGRTCNPTETGGWYPTPGIILGGYDVDDDDEKEVINFVNAPMLGASTCGNNLSVQVLDNLLNEEDSFYMNPAVLANYRLSHAYLVDSQGTGKVNKLMVARGFDSGGTSSYGYGMTMLSLPSGAELWDSGIYCSYAYYGCSAAGINFVKRASGDNIWEVCLNSDCCTGSGTCYDRIVACSSMDDSGTTTTELGSFSVMSSIYGKTTTTSAATTPQLLQSKSTVHNTYNGRRYIPYETTGRVIVSSFSCGASMWDGNTANYIDGSDTNNYMWGWPKRAGTPFVLWHDLDGDGYLDRLWWVAGVSLAGIDMHDTNFSTGVSETKYSSLECRDKSTLALNQQIPLEGTDCVIDKITASNGVTSPGYSLVYAGGAGVIDMALGQSKWLPGDDKLVTPVDINADTYGDMIVTTPTTTTVAFSRVSPDIVTQAMNFSIIRLQPCSISNSNMLSLGVWVAGLNPSKITYEANVGDGNILRKSYPQNIFYHPYTVGGLMNVSVTSCDSSLSGDANGGCDTAVCQVVSTAANGMFSNEGCNWGVDGNFDWPIDEGVTEHNWNYFSDISSELYPNLAGVIEFSDESDISITHSVSCDMSKLVLTFRINNYNNSVSSIYVNNDGNYVASVIFDDGYIRTTSDMKSTFDSYAEEEWTIYQLVVDKDARTYTLYDVNGNIIMPSQPISYEIVDFFNNTFVKVYYDGEIDTNEVLLDYIVLSGAGSKIQKPEFTIEACGDTNILLDCTATSATGYSTGAGSVNYPAVAAYCAQCGGCDYDELNHINSMNPDCTRESLNYCIDVYYPAKELSRLPGKQNTDGAMACMTILGARQIMDRAIAPVGRALWDIAVNDILLVLGIVVVVIVVFGIAGGRKK